MKPSQLAIQLRRIASAIDSSRNPSRSLVARDLKRILAAVDDATGSSKTVETSNSPSGPWVSTSNSDVANLIDNRRDTSHFYLGIDDYPNLKNVTEAGYANPRKGVIVYVRKNGKIYAVFDSDFTDRELASSTYESKLVDERGRKVPGYEFMDESFSETYVFVTSLE